MPQGANSGKKYTYIWVSAIILIFGVIVVPRIVARLKSGETVVKDRMAHMSAADGLNFIKSNGKRRSVPQFELLNQDSVPFGSNDLKDKVYVLDFFFTSCPTICPVMTENLLEIQKTFGEYDDFEIVSITIDPKRDTPSELKKYGEDKGADFDNWNYLTGDREAIYKLAKDGFYMVANEDERAPGGFEHSGLFALIDKEGYLRSRNDKYGNPIIYYRGTVTENEGVNENGEAQQITNLKEDVKKLLAE